MITLEFVLGALLIFALRVMNYAISTIRTVAIARQRRLISASLAFLEAFLFVVVIANIVQDLSNLLYLLAYCLGASVGSYVGMLLEERFITSYVTVNIIANQNGHEIAVALREQGYGVTETIGEGRSGSVVMLRSTVVNRDARDVIDTVHRIDPTAFVALEEARSIMRGWLRVSQPRRGNGG
ncbi:MAG: DUF5698 domain-containing protein [Anaerolineae bacterium]|jgi:uncharacterized protein YebE (UPF0316 family)|nr:DUF5698 domain-containing protein [Anaerolineae bacterium]